MGWILFGIYIIGLIVSIIITARTFKYREGDWEYISGVGLVEKDYEVQKIDAVSCCFLWPLCLAVIILLSPMMFCEWLFNKFEKK